MPGAPTIALVVHRSALCWVVLTTGRRTLELAAALDSIGRSDPGSEAVVVANGVTAELGPEIQARVVHLDRNLGVPGGRDVGLRATSSELVGFLDDDAEIRGDTGRIEAAFVDAPRLGAVSLRLVDETGDTSRRHVPRAGHPDPELSGEVAYFLGGACAIRRQAYEEVGGYFTDLFYGHEEIELSWRLIDAGWKIRYLADVEVFHPRTEISRHADGWFLTGRNRVWIARRTLPWPVAVVHVVTWLALGMVRAPRGSCRDAYRRGWVSGWRSPIAHRPISWRTVWRLTRLGRPPII
jgi:GT2 family glycosyltransferase